MLINYYNLNNPTVLFKQDFDITLDSDENVTDIVMGATNETKTLYTSGGSASSDSPLYNLILDGSSYINFTNGTMVLTQDVKTNLINILTNAKTNDYKNIIVNMYGNHNTNQMVGIATRQLNLSSSSSSVSCYQYMNTMANDGIKLLLYNGDATIISYITLKVTCSDGAITNIESQSNTKGLSPYLPVNNSVAYTPASNSYNPATTKYVDSNDIELIDAVVPSFVIDYKASVVLNTTATKNEVIALRKKGDTKAFFMQGIFIMNMDYASTGEVVLARCYNDYESFGLTDTNPTTNGFIGGFASGYIENSGNLKEYPIIFKWNTSEGTTGMWDMTINFGADSIAIDTKVMVKLCVSRLLS